MNNATIYGIANERGEEAKRIKLDAEKSKYLSFFEVTTTLVIVLSIIFSVVMCLMWINVNFCYIK